jgi:hypothetical protein
LVIKTPPESQIIEMPKKSLEQALWLRLSHTAVPKTRHPKHALIAISPTNTPERTAYG